MVLVSNIGVHCPSFGASGPFSQAGLEQAQQSDEFSQIISIVRYKCEVSELTSLHFCEEGVTLVGWEIVDCERFNGRKN